ncbi:lipocalin-like 1 protein [Eudromia elegans]
MRPFLVSLGLVQLCLLCAEAQDRAPAETDRSKIAGKWHIVALASDSESYLRKKDELKMAMANLSLLEDGTLKVSLAIPTSKGCRKTELIFKKTDAPGEIYHSERDDKTVRVLETDYKSYAVIFVTRVKDGKTLRMMRLYSRTKKVSQKITEQFKRLAKEQGFTDEMVKLLPRQGIANPFQALPLDVSGLAMVGTGLSFGTTQSHETWCFPRVGHKQIHLQTGPQSCAKHRSVL